MIRELDQCIVPRNKRLQRLIGTFWHFKSDMPSERIQLCTFDVRTKNWNAVEEISSATFLIMGFSDKCYGDDFTTNFVVSLVAGEHIRGHWFGTWMRSFSQIK